MLRDDDLRAALVQIGNDGVAVEGFVGDQSAKRDALDERGDADGIEAMTRQQHETHEIAQRIGKREDFGRHAAFGATNGLSLSPPFAPCPWR